jgi:drug/metabolite transporter (DMT)-like permease
VQGRSQDVTARLMLVGVSFAWGLTWPAMKLALSDIPPFSMRTASLAVGAVMLYVLARVQGRSLRIKGRRTCVHVVVIAILNMVVFSICSVFAQLVAPTGRVAMLVYTMPIWASLMAFVTLGEKFTRAGTLALLLCCLGMTVLIYPLASNGIPAGPLLALGAALGWAAGTVYMKWARVTVDPIAIALWQVVIAFFIIGACIPLFQDSVHIFDARPVALAGVLFSGIFGSGLAYFLWFNVINLVPAMTASLGVLSSPVIGVISSMIILGERPTPTDIIGYVLIFAASACVLLQPQGKRLTPEPTN